MSPSSFDPSSLVLLLLGKENSWIPFIALFVVIFQKWNSITNLYNKIMLFGKTQYKVTGVFHTNIEENHTYGSLGASMWALLRFINNLVKADKTLLSNATNIKLPYNDVFEEEDVIVIPTSDAVLKLTDKINCTIEILNQSRDSTKSDRPCMIDSTTITFTLTTTLSFETIMKFMNNIISQHTKIVESKHTKTNYIIKPIFRNDHCGPDTSELSFPEMIKFKTSKSFDNLFFDGKEELIKRLDTFINRDKYKTLGLPETLGLLFHGCPGTGKTSCIKAIAKYLDMSLVIVPMNKIKTKKRLEDLFFSSIISTPQEKRIYVFEEIDCNGWEKIVRHRSLLKDESLDDDDSENILVEKITNAIQTRNRKLKKDKDDDDKLTLGGILEVIDGLIECPGRIIIMTTNHKEHLDSALLRPGRIDMEIEFKKLRHCHIAEIYKKWYGKELDLANDIEDYKYTQAEISQLLFKYENDSKGFIREIKINDY
jgi:hypothetical protein